MDWLEGTPMDTDDKQACNYADSLSDNTYVRQIFNEGKRGFQNHPKYHSCVKSLSEEEYKKPKKLARVCCAGSMSPETKHKVLNGLRKSGIIIGKNSLKTLEEIIESLNDDADDDDDDDDDDQAEGHALQPRSKSDFPSKAVKPKPKPEVKKKPPSKGPVPRRNLLVKGSGTEALPTVKPGDVCECRAAYIESSDDPGEIELYFMYLRHKGNEYLTANDGSDAVVSELVTLNVEDDCMTFKSPTGGVILKVYQGQSDRNSFKGVRIDGIYKQFGSIAA